MLAYVFVAIGGALGSVARFALAGAIARQVGEIFPWGTFVVNVTGCFLIGFIAVVAGPEARVAVPIEVRQFLMVGICGGYTTFSSFSLQTLALARDGDITRAGLNVAASVLVCMLGVWLGFGLGTAVNRLPGA
jgi:CrcB protein